MLVPLHPTHACTHFCTSLMTLNHCVTYWLCSMYGHRKHLLNLNTTLQHRGHSTVLYMYQWLPQKGGDTGNFNFKFEPSWWWCAMPRWNQTPLNIGLAASRTRQCYYYYGSFFLITHKGMNAKEILLQGRGVHVKNNALFTKTHNTCYCI